MRIIVVLVAVLLMFSGCAEYVGTLPPQDLVVLLFTESPQNVEARNSHGKTNLSINVAFYNNYIEDFRDQDASFANARANIPMIRNTGSETIFALALMPYLPSHNSVAGEDILRAFKERFPFIADAQYSGEIGFTELQDTSNIPQAEEVMNFVTSYRDEVCNGNIDTCDEYVQIIQPGENKHIVSDTYMKRAF